MREVFTFIKHKIRAVAVRALRVPTYDPQTEKIVPQPTQVYDPSQEQVYDPSQEKVVPQSALVCDPSHEVVVPHGQAIYDPNVFGRYDLASQHVVPRTDMAALANEADLDILMAEAQRHMSTGTAKLPIDRYSQVLSLLEHGSGICLDACTNQPREDVRSAVTEFGYDYVPIDITGDDKDVRREDLIRLSFDDGSVARIISLDTLEHIEDYTLAVSEMYRVLCDNGLAILHVPCYYFEKSVGEPIRPGIDPFGHVRYFSARELLTALDKAGFIILRAGFQLDYGALLCVAAKNSAIKSKHS